MMSRRLEQLASVLAKTQEYRDKVAQRKKLGAFGVKPGEKLRNPFKPKKLTFNQVTEIIERADRGEMYQLIAKDFGITPQYVGQLKRGKNKVKERFGKGAIK